MKTPDVVKRWRIVKQMGRKLGKPYRLQLGRDYYNGLSGVWRWETEYEEDFNSKAEAITRLATIPDSWGSKEQIQKSGFLV